ncbi:cache domain-containing sensor histidine kinase [Paenibacillus roseipurpureus]|uniref:Sensor histidine kinase n=1 Tax=Paenibacillus roseopurpureus TaxID=2918901 RepID=A0AA96RMS8_9BACL|nr:sensor histidine kinase [Paenibacillus sp. MBLB1832]WNR44632.1 sensor histidine kinase [Paenibacillus sp. MBLB1832]
MRDWIKKWFHNISFRLFLVCLVFVLCSEAILSGLSYRYIKKEITASQLNQATQLLHKEEEYIDLYFLLVQNTLAQLSSSANSWRNDLTAAQAALENVYQENSVMLTDVYMIRKDLSILGGNPVTKVINDTREDRGPLYRMAYSNAYGAVMVSEPYTNFFSGWTVTFTKAITIAGEPMAVAVDLNLTELQERLQRVGGGSNALQLGIMDQEGRVILEPAGSQLFSVSDHRLRFGERDGRSLVEDKDDVIEERINGTVVTMMKSINSRTKWIVFSLYDGSDLQKSLQRMETFFVSLLLLGFLLSVMTAAFVARMIRVPVYYLIRKISQVRHGDLNVVVSSNRRDEFGKLAETFDEMLRQIRTLIEHVNLGERKKKELEIQVLQSQINPHFLYNTLGSISNVVAFGRYHEVDNIIASLISILEYGITDFSDRVSLEQELRNVKDYLYIQQIRYDCEFKLIEDIDPETLQLPVLRMALQPIVENSIFHGYAGGRKAGAIRLSAIRREGHLVIGVEDEGIGMTPEKTVDLLLANPVEKTFDQRKRIGLYNIHQRIRLNYGEPYGLSVWSEPGRGTCVTLTFPDDIVGMLMEDQERGKAV